MLLIKNINSIFNEVQCETGWDLGPVTLYVGFLHLKWQNRRNYKGLNITACMYSWGNYEKHSKGAQINCHFWGARSKRRLLYMTPVNSTSKRVGRPLKPPLQPHPPIHPYPHPILGTSQPSLVREPAGALVTCFHFSVLWHESQSSLAQIPHLIPFHFLLIKESKDPSL